MIWHSNSAPEVIKQVGTDLKTGLTQQEAEKRLLEFGLNQLQEKKKRTVFQKFLDQLKNFMVIVLLIAAALSLSITIAEQTNEWVEPLVIVAIVILNAVLGVIQESRAETAVEALKNMAAPSAKVIRDGATQVIRSGELVPGDIVQLEAGDMVPADVRLMETAMFKCDESALTGESMAVEKDAGQQAPDIAPLGDRLCMAYTGCLVVYGRAKAVVVETGMQTEMGKIADMLSKEKTMMTPLQIRLEKLGKTLGKLALVICAIIFLVGVLTGQHIMEMLITSVSLAVAAIPEGLPAIVTIVLTLGVQRMAKKNAIISRLPAVETMGSANVICSDKTGTLTQNRMTVVQAWAGTKSVPLDAEPPDEVLTLLKLGTLCCDAKIQYDEANKPTLIGDPTETAIVAAAEKWGMEKSALENESPRTAEIPFDSDRKLMSTINMIDGKAFVIVKGAPEILFGRCVSGRMKHAEETNQKMAEQALRVLAIAYKEYDEMPTNISSEELEEGLTLAGLVGLIDPPREEVAIAIAKCKEASIRTVMITGDHITTACAIAKQLGIMREGDDALTGTELGKISDEELKERVKKIAVYARVSPEDKIRIVKAWQSRGAVVSMTGDGVNDAPALKAADIGCAMGITGTDVAKGAAVMILADDNFATIVSAVEEGRGIYDNIRKAVRFLLSCNLGEIFCVLLAIVLGWGTPLFAIQLLLINLVTDSLPALSLSMEPAAFDVMNRPPRRRNESIFAQRLGLFIGLEGLMIGCLTLVSYYLGRFVFSQDVAMYGQTMAFAVLALSQVVHAFNTRSNHSLFRIGLHTNLYMVGAAICSIGITLGIMLTPLRDIFKLTVLNQSEWLWVAILAMTPFVILESCKGIGWIVKHLGKNGASPKQPKEKETKA